MRKLTFYLSKCSLALQNQYSTAQKSNSPDSFLAKNCSHILWKLPESQKKKKIGISIYGNENPVNFLIFPKYPTQRPQSQIQHRSHMQIRDNHSKTVHEKIRTILFKRADSRIPRAHMCCVFISSNTRLNKRCIYASSSLIPSLSICQTSCPLGNSKQSTVFFGADIGNA